MAPDDRALAERVHVAVTACAPELTPKTWYGMPAYADAEGKPVVFFQDAGKFKARYSTIGFQDKAHLDDGEMWPVSYALVAWSAEAEQKVVELVKAAGHPKDARSCVSPYATPLRSRGINGPHTP